MNSRLIQDAVIRNIEIIGEAAKRVSPGFREQHPEIPWKEMAGMRAFQQLSCLLFLTSRNSFAGAWATFLIT